MFHDVFFARVRASLFGGKLTDEQVSGMTAIVGRAEIEGTPIAHLAYMLATAFHETWQTMQPIIETRSPKDKKNPSIETAIKRLDNAFRAGKLSWVKTPYWRKDADGKSWLGRGLVQLTHKRNYEVMSAIVGIDLVKDPDAALQMGIAITIMFEGMTRGSFTGRPLSDYIDGKKADYRTARRVINGMDKADEIAGYALKFEAALIEAGYVGRGESNPSKPVTPLPKPEPGNVDPPVTPAPAPLPPEKIDPEKLDKPLVKSKTVWQWIITTVILPMIAAIENPYVQALLILIVAGFAIYAIKRRADIAKVYRNLKDDLGA